MGLLSRFRKEERMNMQTGRFEPVAHREVKELTREEQFPQRKPSRWQQASERRREEQRIYREEYQKAKTQAMLTRARREGARAGSTSLMDRIAGPPRKPRYTTRNNYNPFGTEFDKGISSMNMPKFDIMDNYGFMSKPKKKHKKRR